MRAAYVRVHVACDGGMDGALSACAALPSPLPPLAAAAATSHPCCLLFTGRSTQQEDGTALVCAMRSRWRCRRILPVFRPWVAVLSCVSASRVAGCRVEAAAQASMGCS
jgi:hypothetical protein